MFRPDFVVFYVLFFFRRGASHLVADVGRNSIEFGISPVLSILVASPPAPIICVKNVIQHSGPHCGLLLRRFKAVTNVAMY